MHDQYLIDKCRRAHNAFEEQHRQFRRKAKEGLEMVLAAVDILLDSASARENRLDRLYQQIDEQTLREAAMSCRYFKRPEERGYLDELCARYAPLRRYLPTFFGLPFQAEIGSESLVAAIDLVRRLRVQRPMRISLYFGGRCLILRSYSNDIVFARPRGSLACIV
jgi:hypothetical protein